MKSAMNGLRRIALLATVASPLACAAAADDVEEIGALEQALVCAKDPGTQVTLYLAPNGSDSGLGTCESPFKTLAKAHSYIDGQDADVGGKRNSKSYTVYLRGGTYDRAEVTWRVASTTKLIRITAYPGEQAILDGKGEVGNAIQFYVARGEATPFEVSYLTFRHYVERGILLRGGYDGDDPTNDVKANAEWTGGATFAHNVFERIGDVYNNVCLRLGRARCLQATPIAAADKDDVVCWKNGDEDEVCSGRAGIGGFNTRHNLIHDNVFAYIESADSRLWGQDSRQVAHAFYVAEFSSGNVLRNNYVTHSSGSAFKLANRCSENVFINNEITFSGSKAFIENLGDSDEGAAPGTDNVVDANTMIFGYPYRDSVASRSEYSVKPYGVEADASADQDFIERNGHFHEGRRPRYERIGGMALGDVDRDGRSELFAAFNYPEFGVSIITRTGPEEGGRYLNKVVLRSKDVEVDGLAVGKFEASGPGTLITSISRIQSGARWARLWRGSGRDIGGAQDLGLLYENDNWTITALATGDFDDNGVDELLSAFKSNGGTRRIYRGGGVTNIGSSMYESTVWDVLAMGAVRGPGPDQLYTSFKRSTSSGYEARMYLGNGVTSVTNGGSFGSSTTRYYPSLALRDPGPAISGGLFNTEVKNTGGTSLVARSLAGAVSDVIDSESSGKFTHVVYGPVANLSAAAITAHQNEFSVLSTESETEIANTNGVVFHTFEPAPPCDPDWDCN